MVCFYLGETAADKNNSVVEKLMMEDRKMIIAGAIKWERGKI